MLGLRILSGFSEADPGVWEDGEIYDPSDGDVYHANIAEDGPTRLRLRGYIGIPLFGRTQGWTRAE